MPGPTRHFHQIAARYGQVDPSDSEAVQRWFMEVLPTLPVETVEEILELLLRGDSAQMGEQEKGAAPEPGYPMGVPLPRLSSSPPAPVPLFAPRWSELLQRLLRRPGQYPQ